MSNPYLDILQSDADRARVRLRATVGPALDSNPDEEARNRRVATLLGVPAAAVAALPKETSREASLRELEATTSSAPATAKRYTDADFAKLAHDDADNLAGIERTVRDYAGAFAGGAVGQGAGSMLSGLGRLYDVGARAIAHPFIAIGGEPVRRVLETPIPDWASPSRLFFGRPGDSLKAAGRAMQPASPSFGTDVAAGLGQLGFSATAYVASGGTLGTVGLLAQGADQVGDRVQNDTAPQALKDSAMLAGGAVSAVTERYAIDKLLGPLAVPIRNRVAAAAARVGITAGAEGGTEFVENVLHDAVRVALTNREAGIDLGDAGHGAGVGATVGALARSLVESALHVRTRGQRAGAQQEAAQTTAQGLQQTLALAEASKLRERDPVAFERVVAGLTHDAEVYIPADALAQALGPELDAVAARVPALANQLDEALATGGIVALPVSELATHLAGQYAQALVPHLRTTPDGPSLSEAETFGQDQRTEMQRLADELDAMTTEDVQATDVEQVRAAVLEQIGRTGRFAPQVRTAYAELVTRFFEATASRVGVTPTELYREFGPRIVSQIAEGAGQFDQSQEGGYPAATDAQTPEGAVAGPNVQGDGGHGGMVPPVLADGEGAAQPLAQGRRGAYDPATRTIALLPSADLSTFIHESGHYFLEVQAELAARSPAIAGDVQTVLDWFGVPDLATWQGMSLEQKRPHHEAFARGFEAYALEGKAPSAELQGVFQRFRAWLLSVYKSVRALDVELSDDVRLVFDRMLATDSQIKATEDARAYAPLFESAEAAGMSTEEFADYQRSGAQATADAVQSLEARSLRDLQWLTGAKHRALRAIQRDAKAKRDAIEAEVAAEVREMPVFAAVRWLKTGELPDGTQTVGAKLSAQALAEMYGDGPATPRRYLSTDLVAAEGGMHPDQVAEMFPEPDGTPAFDSGDALVRAIVAAGREADTVQGMTDQRMLEEHGDLVDARAVERAAEAAIANDARARFLTTEVNTLARAVGNRPVVLRAAREFAEESIARREIRKVRPAQHTAAEARAGRAADAAWKQGDTATAAARKREQLLQNQLARVATRALDEVEKSVDYLRRFETDATRRAIGPEYADQVDALLERFDLRRSTSDRTIERRKSLAEWVEAQQAQGLEPNVDDALLLDAGLTSYRELTVEQMRGLVATVKNIEHLGRLKQKLLTARDERQFDAIVAEVGASILENGGAPRPVALERERGIVPWLRGVAASHRKIASLVRQMDGGRDGGPLWRVLVRGMNDAGTREATMIEEATGKLAELYAPILAMPGGTAGGKVLIPEIGASLSRGARLAVVLNMGNEGNRQRLMDGEGWSAAQIDAIARTLTRTELDFVNEVWAYVDSYWPQIEAKQLRVDGVAEDKVQGQPFTVALPFNETVQMRGGYYPLAYDSDRSSRAESLEAAEVAKGMMRGAFARATTRRGHTKARAEEVKRPVRKDLDVLTEHVSQVVHDLAWHEWLIDANRLIGSKAIDSAIRSRYGAEVVRTLKDDILGIATGDLVPQSAIDRGLRLVRANVSRSTMGLSFTTALLQPFGLTQSMVRIGVRPVLRGVARWAGDAARLESSMGWIGEKSDFMRLRSKTFNRELSEIAGRVGGKSATMQAIDGSLFYLTTKAQMIADIPTWIGRYEKAIEDGARETDAIALADQAVLDAQGGGQIKDLAEVQRKHPMLTQFYSYFSTTLNLAAESTARTDFKNSQAVAGWLADMALLIVVPAIAPALVLSMLRGEDDEPDELAKKLVQAQAGYLLGLVVGARELSGVVSGFAYSGPPVGRIVTDASKAAQQVSQGEIDEPAVLAVVRLLGTAFGIPTVQAIRSYRGWEAWTEDKAPATAVLFGPPAKD